MTPVTIMHQYSIYDPSLGHGTRGSSPAAYISDYISRAEATMSLEPKNYVNDYMQVDKVRKTKDGVAFTRNSLSADPIELQRASNAIAKRYKDGHPFMKTVVSFDNDYLKSIGVLPANFDCNKRGDLFGNVDESRIRLAVQQACEKLGHDFDHLEYVGCVHLDTKHVHVHLCMADTKGERITARGFNKGKEHAKLTRKELRQMKMNVVTTLSDDRLRMLHLSDALRAKQRMEFNAVSDMYIDYKKLHDLLPDKSSLWRYDTNAVSMRDAKQYLIDIFDKHYLSSLQQSLVPLATYEARVTSSNVSAHVNELVADYRRTFVNTALSRAKKLKKSNTAFGPISLAMGVDAATASAMISAVNKLFGDINETSVVYPDQLVKFQQALSDLSSYPGVFDASYARFSQYLTGLSNTDRWGCMNLLQVLSDTRSDILRTNGGLDVSTFDDALSGVDLMIDNYRQYAGVTADVDVETDMEDDYDL